MYGSIGWDSIGPIVVYIQQRYSKAVRTISHIILSNWSVGTCSFGHLLFLAIGGVWHMQQSAQIQAKHLENVWVILAIWVLFWLWAIWKPYSQILWIVIAIHWASSRAFSCSPAPQSHPPNTHTLPHPASSLLCNAVMLTLPPVRKFRSFTVMLRNCFYALILCPVCTEHTEE